MLHAASEHTPLADSSTEEGGEENAPEVIIDIASLVSRDAIARALIANKEWQNICENIVKKLHERHIRAAFRAVHSDKTSGDKDRHAGSLWVFSLFTVRAGRVLCMLHIMHWPLWFLAFLLRRCKYMITARDREVCYYYVISLRYCGGQISRSGFPAHTLHTA